MSGREEDSSSRDHAPATSDGRGTTASPTKSILDDADWFNPFNRDHFAPVTPTVQAWARALCETHGAKPDVMIGVPQYPRWRAWVGYAENAITAASRLGYTAPAEGAGRDPTSTTDGDAVPGTNP